jgi:hypothetical protein
MASARVKAAFELFTTRRSFADILIVTPCLLLVLNPRIP